jgi:hypothetical protein
VPATNELVSDRGSDVTLADAGQSEAEHIVSAVEEVALGELTYFRKQWARQSRELEGLECFARWQSRRAQHALDASLTPVAGFHLEDFEHDRQRVLEARSGEA